MEKPKMESSLPADTESPGETGGEGQRPVGIAAQIESVHLGGASGPSAGAGGDSSPGKRGRGRPPKHGLYSKAAGSDGKRPAKNPPPGGGTGEVPTVEDEARIKPRVAVPPDLLAKVVRQSLTLAENALASAIEGQGRRAGLDDGEIEPQLRQAELGDERKQLVADLAPLILEEWGIDAEMSPTVCAAALLLPWGFGAFTAYSTLSKLAKEKAERESNGQQRV